MSIRDGLARNRRAYERYFGRSERAEQSGEVRLPESREATPRDFAEPFAQPAASPAPAFLPEASAFEQVGGFSLTSIPESDPAQAAEHLLREIEREGRFISQNLQGEDV